MLFGLSKTNHKQSYKLRPKKKHWGKHKGLKCLENLTDLTFENMIHKYLKMMESMSTKIDDKYKYHEKLMASTSMSTGIMKN